MLEPSQQSSQPEEEQDSEADKTAVRTVTLVREEGLEDVKGQYETISSIHIYSLSPARIQDLVTLTDIGRGLFVDTFAKQDPLENNKTYGVIQNPNVRRRKGKRPVIPTGPAPKFQAVKEEAKKSSMFPAKSSSKYTIPTTKKEGDIASRPNSRDSSTTTTTDSTKKPTLKRDASDLFKAFAKQSQQKPKSSLSRESTNQDDTKMTDTIPPADDEGESEDEAIFLDTRTTKPSTKKRSSDAQREREDKQAKLRKMMDEDDDEDEPAAPSIAKATATETEAPPITAQKGTDADVPAGDDEEDNASIAWSDSDTESKSKSESKSNDKHPTSAAQHEDEHGSELETQSAPAPNPRRRRGKRKTMKKRTVKDEEGYLVTREEAVWESFSEDEPEPVVVAKKKPIPALVKNQSGSQGKGGAAAAAAAGKGGAGKKAGNIMSFFGKKA
jgi:DNA polymerase delta subunit 3